MAKKGTFGLEANKGNKEFYPISKDLLTDSSAGVPKNTPKEIASKLGKYSKNVLVSAGKLSYDTVGVYVPNATDFASSVRDVGKLAKEDAIEKYKNIKDIVKNFTANDTDIFETIEKTKKDIIKRLKSGEIYKSSSDAFTESMNEQFGFGDMDSFDFQDNGFSGEDSYIYGDPETQLSSDPFGESSTSVSKKRTTSSYRPRTRKVKAQPNIQINNVTTGGDSSSQIRLGDELVANITRDVGNALIGQQDKLWAKTYAAEELRYVSTLEYQKNILNGVNAIAEHLQNVEGVGTAAQMEFQGKLLALQQDQMGLLKELKEATIMNNPSIDRYNSKSYDTVMGKIISGPGGLNSDEYYKNIKNNLGDIIGSSSFGMVASMLPMLGSMGGMMGGMRPKMDPLSGFLKGAIKSQLSTTTKGRLGTLNDMFNNMGSNFIGRMNEMAEFGDGNKKLIGRLLGSKSTYSKTVNLGLSDPNAIVGWSAKSDRTLNEIIPSQLGEIISALTGREQKFYDYKTGSFRTKGSLDEEYKVTRKNAYANALIDDFLGEMVSKGSKGSSLKKETIKKDFEKIRMNIGKSGISFRPENLTNPSYRSRLLDGIENEESLNLFTDQFQQLSAADQFNLNGEVIKQHQRAAATLSRFSDDTKTNGGAIAAASIQNKDELELLKNRLKNDYDVQIDGPNAPKKGSVAYVQRLDRRSKLEQQIRRLESTSGLDSSTAMTLDANGMTENFGSVGSSNTIVGTVQNIFSLLTKGIIVYPGQALSEGGMPEHLKSIYAKQTNMFKRHKESQDREKREADRIISQGEEAGFAARKLSRQQQLASRGGYGSMLGSILGFTDETKRTKSSINQGVAKATDASINFINKYLGGGSISGKEDMTAYQEIVAEQKRNVLNEIDKQIAKMQGKLKQHPNNSVYKSTLKFLIGRREKILDEPDIIEGLDPVTGIITKPNSEGKTTKVKVTDYAKSTISDIKSTVEESVNRLDTEEILSDINDSASKIKSKMKGTASYVGNVDLGELGTQFNSAKDSVFSKARDKFDSFKERGNKFIKSTGDSIVNTIKGFMFQEDDGDNTLQHKIALGSYAVIDQLEKNLSDMINPEDPNAEKEVIKIIKTKIKDGSIVPEIGEQLVENVKAKVEKGFSATAAFGEAKEALRKAYDTSYIKDKMTKASSSKVAKKMKDNVLSGVSGITSFLSGNPLIGSAIFAKQAIKNKFGIVSGKAHDLAKEQKRNIFLYDKTESVKEKLLTSFFIPKEGNALSKDEVKEERKVALASFGAFNIIQEYIDENVDPEDTNATDEIFKLIDEQVKAGVIDKEIGNSVKSIMKAKKTKGFPATAAFGEAKEALRREYDNDYKKQMRRFNPALNVAKTIGKWGGGIVGTGLMVATGHPLAAAGIAALTLRNSKTFQNFLKKRLDKSGVKGQLRNSIRGNAVGKYGVTVSPFDALLGIKPEDKMTDNELEQEQKIAASTFSVLETIEKHVNGSINPGDPKAGDEIINILKANIKSKSLDSDIGNMIIDRVKKNINEGKNPLEALAEAKTTIQKNYSKFFKSQSRKRSKASKILKGFGTGALIAGTAMFNPLLAAGMTAGLFAKHKSMKAAREDGSDRDKIARLKGRSDLVQGEVVLGNKKSKDDNVSSSEKKVNSISSLFGKVKNKATSVFDSFREGSFLDRNKDKAEEDAVNRDTKKTDALTKMAESMTVMLAGLGINNKGEVEEQNKESVVGILTGMNANLTAQASMQAQSNESQGLSVSGILTKLGKLFPKIATGSAIVGVAATAGLAVRQGVKSIKTFKEEGTAAGIGQLTGLDGDNNSRFNDDGTEKGFLERGADNYKAGRGLLMAPKHVMTINKFGKAVGNRLTNAGAKLAGSADNIAGKVVGKMDGKIPSKILSKIKDALTKFLGSGKVAKHIKADKAATIVSKIMTKISNSAVGNVAKKASGLLKQIPMIGWVAGAALAVTDFINGMSKTNRYFKIGKDDDATIGMKLSAGLAESIPGLLGIIPGIGMFASIAAAFVPPEWICQTVYKLFASEKEEAELAEKQEAFNQRAAELGVDPDRLAEYENKSLGQKIFNKFRSQDKKDAADAKLLGFESVEEYQEWKKKQESPSAQVAAKKMEESVLTEQQEEIQEAQSAVNESETNESLINPTYAGVAAGGAAVGAATASYASSTGTSSSSKSNAVKASYATTGAAATGVGMAALANSTNKSNDKDNPMPGETTKNPVKVLESPLVTNDRVMNDVLSRALAVQEELRDETFRHNGVAEDFFRYMIEYFDDATKRRKKETGLDKINDNNSKNFFAGLFGNKTEKKLVTDTDNTAKDMNFRNDSEMISLGI